MNTLLDVNGLSAWYGAAQILFDVSVRVDQGEVVALMGRIAAEVATSAPSASASV